MGDSVDCMAEGGTRCELTRRARAPAPRAYACGAPLSPDGVSPLSPAPDPLTEPVAPRALSEVIGKRPLQL